MSIATQILELFVQKRHPKDIDYNLNACILLGFASVAVDIYGFSALQFIEWPVMAASVLFILGLALLYNLVRAHGKTERFVQMITAMLGIGLICNVLGLTLGSVKQLIAAQAMIQLWGIYLNICILKETLEISFFKALLILLVLMFTVAMFMIFLFADMDVLQAIQTEAAQGTPQGST